MLHEEIYYTGFLMADREQNKRRANKSEAGLAADDAALKALAMAQTGAVSLVQRRLGNGKYEYIMQYNSGAIRKAA